MAKTAYGSIDQYIAAQREELKPVLEAVRSAIRKALPDAAEVISYQIPAFRTASGVVIYFAGWKQHYSIYPATAAVIDGLGDTLAPYDRAKGTIRLPLDKPVPSKLIGRIARVRAHEVAARAAAKATARRKKSPVTTSPKRATWKPDTRMKRT